MRNKATKRALDAPHVGPVCSDGGPSLRHPIRAPPASPVLGGIHVVHEPGLRPDRGADPERMVLPADERFEVIVNDRLGESRKLLATSRMKEDRVPAEAFGHPRDGRLGAILGSGDLPMRGAGGEPRRDGGKQRWALEVVRGGKRLSRAAAPAVFTTEARNALDVAGLSVPAVTLEASSGSSVRDAVGPGAEGRMEARGTHRFDG